MHALLLAAQSQRYVTHNVLSHGASNTAWTAVFAGLIPIIGLVGVGILIYAFRRGPSDEPDA